MFHGDLKGEFCVDVTDQAAHIFKPNMGMGTPVSPTLDPVGISEFQMIDISFHDTISTAVTYKVMNGERPTSPQGAERLGPLDALRNMVECCLQHPQGTLLSVAPKGWCRALHFRRWTRHTLKGSPGSCRIANRKRTLSDTTLKDDRRAVVNHLPEGIASTVGHQIQHAVSLSFQEHTDPVY